MFSVLKSFAVHDEPLYCVYRLGLNWVTVKELESELNHQNMDVVHDRVSGLW